MKPVQDLRLKVLTSITKPIMTGDEVNKNTEYITDLELKIKTKGSGNDLICAFKSIVIHIFRT